MADSPRNEFERNVEGRGCDLFKTLFENFPKTFEGQNEIFSQIIHFPADI
jgi:hypothetical protein